MLDNNIYTQERVSEYISLGFAPIPVNYKSKTPVNAGWNHLSISQCDIGKYFNGHLLNIGILTGEPSQGLVDVDIDAANAPRFAPRILPKTNCIFGHESKPRSHWVYRVPDAETHKQFKSNGMIVEVRGNKRYTVFPGSVHPSGEPIEFEDRSDYLPGSSTWNELVGAAAKIAISNELFEAWKPGQRHDMALATAAKLARVGWCQGNVRYLIEAIATEANDEELADRLLAVDTTFESYAQGRPVTGEERLIELLGLEKTENIQKWVSPQSSSLRSISSPSHENVGAIRNLSYDLTSDAGAADTFTANFKDDLVWCGDDEWYLRKKEIFESVRFEIVQGLAKEFLQDQVGGINQAPLMLSAFKACLGRTRINASVELSKARLFLEPARLDANRDLAGCVDGSVLRLAPENTNTDSVFVTKKLGTKSEDGANCPDWMEFLNQIFEGDCELISFLQRAVGYSLTGHVCEQCLFNLVGTGANGKSTFLKVLQCLLGDYAGTVPMQTLMQQRHGTQTNDLAHLVGKRLIVASEGEPGQRLAESKIKLMTGGDRIACRALYQNFFEFDPQFKLWLATNDLPEITGTTEAIWRRIRVIEFPVTIPPAEQDKGLADRLIAELPGISQWALHGLSEWRKTGLAPPECVLQSTKSYRHDNDTVGQWIESACICESGRRASMKDLYESYKVWCEHSSLDVLPNAAFGKELTRRGFAVVKTNRGNYRRGIGLKVPPNMVKQ
jgi:putative DNA primase/helicase